MKAEIIAVGSELLTPHFQDTNSLYCTARLNETGFEVHLKTIVGDSEKEIAEVLRSALQRSKLIILSGGLGPTEDDLTRYAVAGVLGRPIRTDQGLLDALRHKFASRGYSMPRINERQAEVIQGAVVLENPMGTAPGLWLEEKGVYLALLPGPPRELRPMIENEVIPRIASLGEGRKVFRRSLSIAGLTESEVDSRAAPIYRQYPKVKSTILAGTGHISMHFSQWSGPQSEPRELEELFARIREVLGHHVFTTENESLEEVVARLLLDSSQSLSVAESCTAGMVGSRLTSVRGSSRYFLGGVLCYSNESKSRLCGVSTEILERHGAVSGETAEALARGVRELFGGSIGLSVTGIAGPDGGTAEKPVGLVYVGVAGAGPAVVKNRLLPGDRSAVRERASFFALSCLRHFLSSSPGRGES